MGSPEHGGPQDGLVGFSLASSRNSFFCSLGYLGIVDLLFFLSVGRRREELSTLEAPAGGGGG